jgi:hypothetical protein
LNNIVQRDLQRLKQLSPKTSTVDGIETEQIDKLPENALLSIWVIVDVPGNRN